ncbi:TetR/AcrR family transcriptional regulator [Caballeronia sp. LZ062]|uniref:TetR/AcrR family transcriptional regulator n=1 Tax=unclassified Caballeronia TaxID=2646786 RepID=UPI002856A39A|nr:MULTISPECIES: TetR/AcrR family transcriptional regulator [unclassified Caballeronia]MDR5872700.1 TetR/AcrR family transcriptional regulator [Caballeronia sp. LZ062]
MQGRKQVILEAALATLWEEVDLGFTQPRVAKRAGVRQCHLIHDLRTRVEPVARAAINGQFDARDAIASESSPAVTAASIAAANATREHARPHAARASLGGRTFDTQSVPRVRRCHRRALHANAQALGLAVNKVHMAMSWEPRSSISRFDVRIASGKQAPPSKHSSR